MPPSTDAVARRSTLMMAGGGVLGLLMAGYGLQLWPILQDLHQLWSVYGERAGTFLSNAGLIQIFNVGDVETASWVSKSIGAATMAYQTAGASVSKGPGPFFFQQTTTSTSTANHLTRRELLTPDEVMREQRAIVFVAGEPAWLLDRIDYRTDTEYRGSYDPNPYHAGPRA